MVKKIILRDKKKHIDNLLYDFYNIIRKDKGYLNEE